ncbi:MAG: hypothetical protein QOF85_1423 [Solirubrobacterales bacterium]|nr:hypothetical protein [Solirubrobacterales bacterium]
MKKLATTIALATFCLIAPAAHANAPQPTGLRVDGGEDSWHVGRLFALRWINPPGSIAAAHYRLLDPQGQILIADTRLPWAATSLDHVSVSPAPGVYTIEVWLEDSNGDAGTPVSATLRFDDSHPSPVEPLPQPGWIGRTAFPYTIRFSHPSGTQPLSGIRGYAVSIDSSPSGDPCPSGTCSDAETDLRAGVGADRLSVGELPEGTNYVHAVAVSGSGMPSMITRTAALHVDKRDPETTIAGVADGWSKGPVTLTANASDTESGMAVDGPGDPFTAIRIGGGAPTVSAGASVTATVIASGVHTVVYYARDAAGNVNDGGFSNGHPNRAVAKTLVKIDREPPTLAFASAQSPLDPERIETRVADSHSGLDFSRGSIALRQVGSSERFVKLPTELSAGLLRTHWDSSAYPAGEYEFRATAFDRAGNSGTTSTRVDGTAMRLQGPLKSPIRLMTKAGRRIVRYGRGTWFGGRLIGGRHTPLANMAVRVIERFSNGSTPTERLSTVRTEANGKFGLRLAPGPSRQVIAEVAPTATTRGASSDPLILAVHTRLVLRVSSAGARIGGPPVIFRGKVASGGASVPADGKVVQLQFRLPGLPWSEFRTVRTDRQGRFRYAYRFADDDSHGVRFQFRAYAPAQAGWPFEPAGSLPVAVLGA